MLAAVELALEAGASTKTHILKLLHRLVDGKPIDAPPVKPASALTLTTEPQDDVERYHALSKAKLLVALGVHADAQKMLLAVKNIGSKSQVARRDWLATMDSRRLRASELVILDCGSSAKLSLTPTRLFCSTIQWSSTNRRFSIYGFAQSDPRVRQFLCQYIICLMSVSGGVFIGRNATVGARPGTHRRFLTASHFDFYRERLCPSLIKAF